MYFFSVAGKLSDIKSTWSSGPISHTQASLSHELWKVPRNTTAPTRPPPGLTNTKPSSTWGASPLGWTSSYSSGTLDFCVLSHHSAFFLPLFAFILCYNSEAPHSCVLGSRNLRFNTSRACLFWGWSSSLFILTRISCKWSCHLSGGHISNFM